MEIGILIGWLARAAPEGSREKDGPSLRGTDAAARPGSE
jgi:hypothetical protein